MNRIALFAGFVSLIALTSACGDSPTSIVGTDGAPLETANFVTIPVGGVLSTPELTDLLYMREEEKLAHDVYVVLYDAWTLQIHDQISRSEQLHTDAIKALLDRYGVEDPVGNNGLGVFADPVLQNLYDDLIAQGTSSAEEALRIGCAIEEIDILDLEDTLSRTTHADIITVYGNLTRGSENHLRGFVRALDTMFGITYEPLFLSREAYDAILAGAGQPGGIGNGNAGNGGKGRGNSGN